MATETEKRKGGGKLSRSETVTVRLDPKLRYLAELAARKQRRTLSSYVEWVLEDSLTRTNLYTNGGTSLADESAALWDVDEADRFVKLALRHPDLLTHEEQVRWKLIRECPGLWRGRYAGKPELWTWTVQESSLAFDNLREHWQALCAVADGDATAASLPEWLTRKTKATTGFDDMDDEVPF